MLRHFLQVDDITCCNSGRFLSPRRPAYSLTDAGLAQRRNPKTIHCVAPAQTGITLCD